MRGSRLGAGGIYAFGLWAAALGAAPPSVDELRFRSYSIDQGLSQSTARALAQDDRGFLWIGTQDGLNRFDGQEFRVFRRDRLDPQALPDSHVTALAYDGRNGLWIGTLSAGVLRLDLVHERFDPLADPESLATSSVSAMTVEPERRLWVATVGGGVQALALDDGSLEPPLAPEDRLRNVRALLWQPEVGLWIGAATGVHRVAPGRRQAEAILTGIDATALALGTAGRLWVGTSDAGLIELDADGRVLRRLEQREGPFALPDRQIRSLLWTRAGELWIGTANGLAILAADGSGTTGLRRDPADARALPANRVVALLEDRDGAIWVGTWTGGIAVHLPKTRMFRVARHRTGDPSSLPSDVVRALWLDADGRLWLGLLEGGGLVEYRMGGGVLGRHVHRPDDPTSLSNDLVQAIERRRNGELWVGTHGGGVNRYLGDGRFERPALRSTEDRALGRIIQDLYEDAAGTLWIATGDTGLAALCARCERFVAYGPDVDDPSRRLPIASVNSVLETADGMLWVASYGGGLALLDAERKVVEVYRARPDDPRALGIDSLTTLLEDRNGWLWVGTQGAGVALVERGADGRAMGFRSFGTLQGLASDAIGGLMDDAAGRLWVASTLGISVFDPRSGRVRNVTAIEGLDRAGYFVNATARTPEGAILFGGLAGLVQFDPSRLSWSERPAGVLVSELRVLNTPARPRWRDPDSPLDQAITHAKAIVLNARATVWSVRFSSLSLASADSLRFEYRLSPFQREPILTAPGERTATFTQVPAGRYVLSVRATTDGGMSFGPPYELAVRIRPHWWASWPALAGYTLGGILLTLLLARRAQRRWQEKRARDEAVRSSQERLQLALWGSRDELWDIDLKTGRLVRENPIGTLNAQSVEYIPTIESYLKIVHPQDQEALRHALEQHMAGETDYYEATFRARARDGGWIWVLSRGQATERNAHGRARRIIGTNRDITSFMQQEDELRRLNEELEQRVARRTEQLTRTNEKLQATVEELTRTQRQLVESEKMASLGNLVAGVAHEINTPVGVAVTAASHLGQEMARLAEMVEHGQLRKSELLAITRTAVESSGLVLKNLERAGQLIRGFKQVAVDQSSEQRRVVDLKTYIDEILIALRPRLKRSPHQIEVECAEGLSLDTYPGALYQILVNFVTNSLTHAFPGERVGTIRIQVQTEPGAVVLLYRDDGVGMSEEVRARVFEPFFTTKRGQGGSGLGLHIVYNLVTQLLRGTVECQSAPEQGCTFTVRIPSTPPSS